MPPFFHKNIDRETVQIHNLNETIGLWMVAIPHGFLAEWDGKVMKCGGKKISIPLDAALELPATPCIGIVLDTKDERLFRFKIIDIPNDDVFEKRQELVDELWRSSLSPHMTVVFADNVPSIDWVLSKYNPEFHQELWFFEPGSKYHDKVQFYRPNIFESVGHAM